MAGYDNPVFDEFEGTFDESAAVNHVRRTIERERVTRPRTPRTAAPQIGAVRPNDVFWLPWATPQQRGALLARLVPWVEDLIKVYQPTCIPACWLLHPRIVIELAYSEWQRWGAYYPPGGKGPSYQGPASNGIEIERLWIRLEGRYKVTCTSDKHEPDPVDIDLERRTAYYEALCPDVLSLITRNWPTDKPADAPEFASTDEIIERPGQLGIETNWS